MALSLKKPNGFDPDENRKEEYTYVQDSDEEED
jgi:hypothetical protein